MKKIIALLITVPILFSVVTGCSQKSVSQKSVSSNAKTTTINFLIVSDDKVLQPTFDLYEKENPGVKINLEVLPIDSLFQTIDVRLSAGDSTIDAMLVDAPLIANYAVKGYTAGLDNYIDATAKKNLTPSSIQTCTYNNKLMALPLNSSCVELYYNKDIFAAKGITLPDNDVNKRWTWEQVAAAAQKLTYTDNGKKVWGLTFEQINMPYQLLPLGQSLGANKLVSDDGLTTTGYTNSAAMVKGAQFYYDTFNTWKISPNISGSDSISYFTSGQVAMFVGGSWQIPAMQAAKMNFGYAPHPYFQGGVPVTPTGSWCVGVSSFSKQKAATAKFVQFLTTDNQACQLNLQYGENLPCNVNVLNSINTDPKYSTFPNDVMKLAVYESLHTAAIRPQLAGYDEWQANMEKAYSDIMNGEQPAKALNAATAEIDVQLQKYKQ
jgi:ABC-type glycerol-3-phosphate transport system substrate-binding protein